MGFGTHVKRAAIAVALLAGLAVIDQGAPAGAIDPLPVGFNVHPFSTGNYTHAQMVSAASDIAPGAIIRVVVPWHQIQPGKTFLNAWCSNANDTALTCTQPLTPNWYYVDQALGPIANSGLPILLVPMSAPPWARDGGDIRRATPPNVADSFSPPGDSWAKRLQWQNFVASLVSYVQNHPGWDIELAGVEVWNEQNGWLNWNTVAGPNPGRYARALCSAWAGVRSVDADLPVLFGGIHPLPGDGFTDPSNPIIDKLSPQAFISGAYANGAAPCFDSLAYHAYPSGTGPTSPLADHQAGFIDVIDEARDLIAAYDPDPDTPISITETNIVTNFADASVMEDFLPWAYEYAEDADDIDMFLVHALFPMDADSAICASPLNPKPAAHSLKDAIAGSNVANATC